MVELQAMEKQRKHRESRFRETKLVAVSGKVKEQSQKDG